MLIAFAFDAAMPVIVAAALMLVIRFYFTRAIR